MKRIGKLLLLILLIIVVGLNIPIIQMNHEGWDENKTYENWMKDTISNDTKLVDIKMLGAHDAFTKDINYASDTDYYADNIMRGFTGALLKGFLVRQSVTQIDDIEDMLISGVRYFDVRLTYDVGRWYTKHNYFSDEFKNDITFLTEYLSEVEGEFIILDFQHINGIDYESEEDYQLFLDMLDEVGLIDYVYYQNNKLIGDITYQDITNNGTESRIIVIDKFTSDNRQTYQYETSIRSNWPNDDDFDVVMDYLREESNQIQESSDLSDTFIVMQAVVTMQMDLDGIVDGIRTWSLVERAEDFNQYLLEQDDFSTLMDNMPIVMVDYATGNQSGFVDDIMERIIEANS